jgi:diadenosine tetraphosphatase ApaH/serine/threonine PP2A family protein phosphatase
LRYAILSDLHGNVQATEAVLAYIDGAQIDTTVCLGDVVGYGASPNECIAAMRDRNIPTVCGNHDAVASGREEPWGFNPIALAAAMWTREQLTPENLKWLEELPDSVTFEHFVAAHGSPTDRDCYMFTWEDVLPHLPHVQEQGYNLCFFGHTHSPGIYSADGAYTVDDDGKFQLGDDKTFFINVGSVGQPRDGDARSSLGVYDSDTREFELVRVAYDVEATARDIVKAGLPDFLAERLFLGR